MANQQPLAYLDQDFLESTDARPLRILAEYMDPLRRLKQQNIQDTVVFFGSRARAQPRERARARCERCGPPKRKRTRDAPRAR